jgi:hypothetical protein
MTFIRVLFGLYSKNTPIFLFAVREKYRQKLKQNNTGVFTAFYANREKIKIKNRGIGCVGFGD